MKLFTNNKPSDSGRRKTTRQGYGSNSRPRQRGKKPYRGQGRR